MTRKYFLVYSLAVAVVLPIKSAYASGIVLHTGASAGAESSQKIIYTQHELGDNLADGGDLYQGGVVENSFQQNVISQRTGTTYLATVVAKVKADYGSIGASAFSAISGSSFGTGFSGASAGVNVVDYITVESSTLSQGTLVPLTFRTIVHVDQLSSSYINRDAGQIYTVQNITFTASANGAEAELRLCNGCIAWEPGKNYYTLDLQVSARVGAQFQLLTSINADAQAYAYLYYTVKDPVPSSFEASSSAISLNTATSYFYDPNPEIKITSQSGHNYLASSVPEPSSALLVLAGVAILFGRNRRPQRRAAA